MSDLPSVSAFEIKKKLNNSQERYYGKNNLPNAKDSDNILVKINKIFSSKNFVYKSRVRIYFADDVKECVIVGKTNDSLLTLSNEKIRIIDIKDIEKI